MPEITEIKFGLELDAKTHDALGDIMVLEAVFKRICDKFVSDGLKDS